MKLYFTESGAKNSFVSGLLFQAISMYYFCTRSSPMEWILFGLFAGTILLSTLGRPFFYYLITGYYPSGFKSPIEKVPALLSDYNLATMDEHELIHLSSVTTNEELYALLKNAKSNDSLSELTKDIKIELLIPSLAYTAIESLEYTVRNRAFSLLFIKQTELTKTLNERSDIAQSNKVQLQNPTPISFE